jgi:hypothetical protein
MTHPSRTSLTIRPYRPGNVLLPGADDITLSGWDHADGGKDTSPAKEDLSRRPAGVIMECPQGPGSARLA